MRSIFFLLLSSLLLTLFLPADARNTARRGAPEMPGWQLTFDDEFSGSALDTREWTSSTGTFTLRSSPIQYYKPSAVILQGGVLQIQSLCHLGSAHRYTSGEIRTLDKFSQRYGRLETRCRFPTDPGTWPPEIDATEFLGRTPETLYLTNHWVDGAGEPSAG